MRCVANKQAIISALLFYMKINIMNKKLKVFEIPFEIGYDFIIHFYFKAKMYFRLLLFFFNMTTITSRTEKTLALFGNVHA